MKKLITISILFIALILSSGVALADGNNKTRIIISENNGVKTFSNVPDNWKEKEGIRVWTDENGVKHFSNVPDNWKEKEGIVWYREKNGVWTYIWRK